MHSNLSPHRATRVMWSVSFALLSSLFVFINQAPPAVANALVIGDGFDVCGEQPNSAMDQFRTQNSFVGVYIGGLNDPCGGTSASWVNYQLSHGWNFIPIWDDLGNPCGLKQDLKMSSNSYQAHQQGVDSANRAINTANPLGFGPSGILYTDIEAWEGSDNTNQFSVQTCKDAERAFLDGWTARLHARGYKSGFYSSSGGGEMAYMYGGSARPDFVFYGEGDHAANTNSAYIPAGDWASHQRVKQYNLNVPDSRTSNGYGVDWDCANSTLDGFTNSSISC